MYLTLAQYLLDQDWLSSVINFVRHRFSIDKLFHHLAWRCWFLFLWNKRCKIFEDSCNFEMSKSILSWIQQNSGWRLQSNFCACCWKKSKGGERWGLIVSYSEAQVCNFANLSEMLSRLLHTRLSFIVQI